MNASNGRPSQHLGMNGETYSDEVPRRNASNGKILARSFMDECIEWFCTASWDECETYIDEVRSSWHLSMQHGWSLRASFDEW